MIERQLADSGVPEVASIWRRRVAWSRAADRLKRRVSEARTWTLLLAITGAALETVATTFLANTPRPRTWCAAAGAVLLAVGTYLTTRLLSVDAVRDWIRARSASEGIKREVYLFRAGSNPYIGDGARVKLTAEVRRIEESARDLERHVAQIDVTDAPAAPNALAPEDYVKLRVQQQVDDYYRKKARQLANRLSLFRGLEFTLGLLATVLAAAAAYVSGHAVAETPQAGTAVGAWVAVLTTVGGAIAAHVAANRYDFLVMSYYATARRLEELIEDWRSAGAPTDVERWSVFVHSCEDAISVENESWLAKWSGQEPERRNPSSSAR